MKDMMWPRKNANIKEYDKDSAYCINLKIDGDVSDNFSLFADNFYAAAKQVMEYVLDKGEFAQLDCYFFSIVYLYRHSLELKLKAIAFNYINDKELQKNFIKDTRHNLLIILERISKYIKINDEYSWIKGLFNNMNSIDKESDAFRYPIKIIKDKDGCYGIKKFFENQQEIDLEVFKNKMDQAFKILDSYYKSGDYSEKIIKYNTMILEEGGEFYSKSVIGYNYGNNFYGLMVDAYSECGKYLENLIIKNPSLKNVYFFPMCYLFRNAIELELKQIWFEECAYSFQEKCKKLSKTKHSFFKLWNMIDADVKYHTHEENDQNVIIYIKNYINQIHEIDSSSSFFRYPTNKNMDYYFKKNTFFDAKNVGDFFQEMSEFFKSIDYMMKDHNEWLEELEAEYKDW